jgi:hypothetical protein
MARQTQETVILIQKYFILRIICLIFFPPSKTLLRPSLFRDVMQYRLAMNYQRFGTTYRSHVKGSSIASSFILHNLATVVKRVYYHDQLDRMETVVCFVIF